MLQQGLGQEGVEAAVPVDVAAQPDRHPVAEHLHHPAQRVAVLGRALDLLDHRLLVGRVVDPHRRLVDARQVGHRRPAGGLRHHRSHLDHVRQDGDVEVPEQGLGAGAGRHPGGRLPGRGPLEHVACVGEAVLLHPGQVGVPGPGAGERLLRPPRSGGHLLLPLGPLRVADLERHRRPEGAAVADAAQDGELVLLEAHPGPPAVAQPAPGQLGLDLRGGDPQPCGQSLDGDEQGPSVGFAGGEEAEHAPNLPGAGTTTFAIGHRRGTG